MYAKLHRRANRPERSCASHLPFIFDEKARQNGRLLWSGVRDVIRLSPDQSPSALGQLR